MLNLRAKTEIPETTTCERLNGLVERARQNSVTAQKLKPVATETDTEANRRQREARILRGMNFPAENLCPELAQVAPDFRPVISEYCDNIADMTATHTGVFLGGGLGSGKTSCLALIALAAYQSDIPAVYMRSGQDVAYACDIVDARHRTYVTSYNSAAEVTDSTKQWPHSDAKILLIDDLDYTDNDAALSVVGRYLYNAYANEQCVCVGCNLTWYNMVTIKALSRVADRWERHIPPHRRLMTAENSLRAKR